MEAILFAVLLMLLLLLLLREFPYGDISRPQGEEPARAAGIRGEHQATDIIRSVLQEGDRLLTNVQIDYEGRQTELDNVIVNRYGVFIIEVKNYSGTLIGNEEDYEWTKYRGFDADHTYCKIVKNPIKQVKRQIYLLAKHLEYYSNVRVWIEGYVMLLHKNSPVVSKFILESTQEIDSVIHARGRNHLSQQEIDTIIRALH